jgi:histidinol-phosphate aminotransferase
MDFDQIIRPHFLKLTPYSSAKDDYTGDQGILLDANENPFELIENHNFNRYPDPYQKELKAKIALLKGVKPENIFLGNGSDEPIDLLIKLVCRPNESNIVIMPPTYGMYKVCADIQEIFIQQAPLSENFDIDLDNVFDAVNAETKIIWICSPNNPSGNLLSDFSIVQILKANPEKIVVIDEAYIDFAQKDSYLNRLSEFENLVVLQTFSKSWGLAGLRLGMAFAHPVLIKYLNKIKYPYNLNVHTQKIALEALNLVDKKDAFVNEILANRTYLTERLTEIAQVEKIYPSDANMLLVKIKDANSLYKFLIKNLVIVRDRSNVTLCENCLRISIGTKPELDLLIEKIKLYFEV